MWGYLIGFLAVALVVAAGLIYETAAEKRDARRPPPGRLVAVNGHRLHIYTSGERRPGQPLAVLISGMSDWSLRWYLVQPEVAKFARVCSYDRAGYGWSEDDGQPRRLENMAEELHTLLVKAGEPAPYLFVGHSLGAMIARIYNGRYPGEVVGMVLPDPGHEGFFEQVAAFKSQLAGLVRLYSLAIPLARIGFVRLLSHTPLFPNLTTGRRSPEVKATFYAQISTPKYFRNMLEEIRNIFLDAERALEVLRSSGSLGDMPLVVIRPLYQDESRKLTERQRENVRILHEGLDRLAALSSKGRIVTADQSWHDVAGDQPEVVVEAIRQMVETITSNES